MFQVRFHGRGGQGRQPPAAGGPAQRPVERDPVEHADLRPPRLPGLRRGARRAPAVATGVAAALKALGRGDIRVVGQGKNVPLIAMAHEIPYVATATVADPRDLEYKATRAMDFHGAPLRAPVPPRGADGRHRADPGLGRPQRLQVRPSRSSGT
jgi:hypothetical protein